MAANGAVEIGGTNLRMALGISPEDLDPTHLPTTRPEETLSAVTTFFSGRHVDAVGVASFGPLDLDRESTRYGTMLTTPKPGWSGTPVLQVLADGIDAPVVLNTDVNAAALGEGRWGATRGMSDFAYITVGTGIGAGVVSGGSLVGHPRHPEAGHVMVRRLAGDAYPGRCPRHADCLEGMASGPALEDRFGPPGSWAGNADVTALASWYLAQGVLGLVYIVVPERVVIGGGVSRLPGFHARVRHDLREMLADYPTEPDLELMVSPPGLGQLSGLAGALVLAEAART